MDTKKEFSSFYNDNNIENFFGITSNSFYSVEFSNALNTPIYSLLEIDYYKTIDFILRFTNSAVLKYSCSANESVKRVPVYIDDGQISYQYVTQSLWSMYRGTGSPVMPCLLQSIHMALEKFLLELGKESESHVLESLLLYLLRKSESASITAVVSSVVLAYPEKTFNVAKVLFKTKEFFICDNIRLYEEDRTQRLYSLGLPNIYKIERLLTCKDEHRKKSLATLMRDYQLLILDMEKDGVNSKRKIILDILDSYYDKLPAPEVQTDEDKLWRTILAGIDFRKMNINIKKTDKKTFIEIFPKLDNDLQEYINNLQNKNSEIMEHSELMMWSEFKFKKNSEYIKYQKYEKDPLVAIKEVKILIEEIKNNINLFNCYRQIPPFVCSVLIENNLEILSNDDKLFCLDIIIKYASRPLNSNYFYQSDDGVEPSTFALPTLMDIFPDKKNDIKKYCFCCCSMRVHLIISFLLQLFVDCGSIDMMTLNLYCSDI